MLQITCLSQVISRNSSKLLTSHRLDRVYSERQQCWHRTKSGSSVVFTRWSFDILDEPVKDLYVAVDGDVNLLHALRVSRQVLGKVAHLLNKQVTWTSEVLLHCTTNQRTQYMTLVLYRVTIIFRALTLLVGPRNGICPVKSCSINLTGFFERPGLTWTDSMDYHPVTG